MTFWTHTRPQHFFVQIQSKKLACEETEGTCRGRLINFSELKVINFNICGKETNKISQRHLRKESCGYFTDKLKILVFPADRKGVQKDEWTYSSILVLKYCLKFNRRSLAPGSIWLTRAVFETDLGYDLLECDAVCSSRLFLTFRRNLLH